MKGVKVKVIGFLSLIVISILIVTWFFPFSIVSVYKNINYTTNSDSVRIHIKYLDNLQKLYDESSPDDVTTLVLQNISHMYEQDWLVKNDAFKMNKDELAKMLMGMRNAREGLLNLTTQEEYSMEQRMYLLMIIENVLSMEDLIEDMMEDSWENRTVVKRQFRNLHGAFTSSLMVFNSFYDTTQDR
jgi:hypothetical protein